MIKMNKLTIRIFSEVFLSLCGITGWIFLLLFGYIDFINEYWIRDYLIMCYLYLSIEIIFTIILWKY